VAAPAIVDICERIAEHFPLGGQPDSLEVVPGATGRFVRGSDEPTAVATIRSITWDRVNPATGEASIRDFMTLAGHHSPKRSTGVWQYGCFWCTT
jgi:hypothetical protein